MYEFIYFILLFLLGSFFGFFLWKLFEKKTDSNEETKILIKNLLEPYERILKDNAEKISNISSDQKNFVKNSESVFKNIANEVLFKKSDDLKKTNKETIENLIQPYRENVNDLIKQINQLCISHNQSISNFENSFKLTMQETRNLSEALSYQPKVRGNWGETTLRRIFDSFGLKNEIDYEFQKTFILEKETLRPDFVVNLPENRSVIIDCKVNFISYKNYLETEEEDQKKIMFKGFIEDVKKSVLDAQKYLKIKNSPDFVVVFIPIESAYQHLIEYSLESNFEINSKRVFLVSPYSVIAFLRLIKRFWNDYKVGKKQEELKVKVESLCTKLINFFADMKSLGANIERLHKNYDDATKKLYSGRDSIEVKINQLINLGIDPKNLDKLEEINGKNNGGRTEI